MNIKKAIVSAIIQYAIVFLVASAFLFLKGQMIFGVITLGTSVVATFLMSKEYYFKGMKITNPIKEGLMFGFIVAVIVFLIEIPVMVYGFAKDMGWGYFMSWNMLMGYLLNILIPVLVAYRIKKK